MSRYTYSRAAVWYSACWCAADNLRCERKAMSLSLGNRKKQRERRRLQKIKKKQALVKERRAESHDRPDQAAAAQQTMPSPDAPGKNPRAAQDDAGAMGAAQPGQAPPSSLASPLLQADLDGGKIRNATVYEDTRVIARAVREGWDIPEAARKVCPQLLLEIMASTVPQPEQAGRRGPSDYKFATGHRIRAVEVMADMAKSNFVMEQARGDGGTGPDGEKRVSLIEIVQQVEQKRRTQVVDAAFIDAAFAKLPPPPVREPAPAENPGNGVELPVDEDVDMPADQAAVPEDTQG